MVKAYIRRNQSNWRVAPAWGDDMLELNRLYNMDCMDGMREFPDNYFDLAIVDPPYGISAPTMNMGSHKTREGDGYPAISVAERIRKGRLNSGGGKLKDRALNTMNCNWDFFPPTSEYFDELRRVSKHQIIWGGNYFDLPPSRGIIVWDKLQPWDNFSQVEIAWTSFNCPASIFRYSNTGGRNDIEKINPTQKPVALYCFCLNKHAKAGYKILDTHAGSASSLVACHNSGFEFVGFEIDPNMCAKANERLAAAQSQQLLF